MWSKEVGQEERGVVVTKQHKGSLWGWNCSLSKLRWRIPEPTRVIQVHRSKFTHTHTHLSTSKTGEIRIIDYLNVNLLVIILYFGFAKYDHWEKLGKGHAKSLLNFLQPHMNP